MAPWLAAFAASLSALGGIGAATVATVSYRGQLFELARSLHQDLTTGSVQDARNTLGGVAHGGRVLEGEQLEEGLDAYFRLLWCFERINAGYQVMGRHRCLGRQPRRFLADLITWHVQEWATNFRGAGDDPGIRAELDRALNPRDLHDTDSWRSFQELANALGVSTGFEEATRR